MPCASYVTEQLSQNLVAGNLIKDINVIFMSNTIKPVQKRLNTIILIDITTQLVKHVAIACTLMCDIVNVKKANINGTKGVTWQLYRWDEQTTAAAQNI